MIFFCLILFNLGRSRSLQVRSQVCCSRWRIRRCCICSSPPTRWMGKSARRLRCLMSTSSRMLLLVLPKVHPRPIRFCLPIFFAFLRAESCELLRRCSVVLCCVVRSSFFAHMPVSLPSFISAFLCLSSIVDAPHHPPTL